ARKSRPLLPPASHLPMTTYRPGFDGSPARIACWLRPDPCFHSILSGSVKATAAGLRSAAIALVNIVADAATPRNKRGNECILVLRRPVGCFTSVGALCRSYQTSAGFGREGEELGRGSRLS